MESWPVPPLPRLAGVGRAPLIHDTATGAPQVSATGPHARMYVCGITPYDATHMGHAATYVAFDLLQRAWRDAGLQVTYVQNVTDVDDPLLERAQMLGQDWREIAARETALFRDDMAALRVIPPDHYLGVTESLHLIEELIGRLQAAGAAYAVDDDLYFPVAADPGFGSVSGLDRAAMTAVFAERGGDPDRPGKADPLDALLWQAARPEEPAWESSLGHGRPGWHVECTAIALHHLGMEFDVQGGGSDLAFPHHEMSASQAVAAHGGGEFARRYVHAGMVGLDGEKMSKSRGNLVFVSALRAAGHDPMALRLALLDHHYRSDWEWTPAGLTAAEERLARWRAAFAAATGAAAEPLIAAVRAALAEDLDAPRALAVVDDWAATGGDEAAAPAAVADAVDALLGVR